MLEKHRRLAALGGRLQRSAVVEDGARHLQELFVLLNLVGVLENLVAYFGNLTEKTFGWYIVGNGEKLSVALIIVITILTLKPAGLFGRVITKRV